MYLIFILNHGYIRTKPRYTSYIKTKILLDKQKKLSKDFTKIIKTSNFVKYPSMCYCSFLLFYECGQFSSEVFFDLESEKIDIPSISSVSSVGLT